MSNKFCHSLGISLYRGSFPHVIKTVEPPLTATSLQGFFFFSSPRTVHDIDNCLNLSTTATATKARPQLTAKITSRQRPVSIFSHWRKIEKWSLYLIRMARRRLNPTRILIVFYSFCCSKLKTESTRNLSNFNNQWTKPLY